MTSQSRRKFLKSISYGGILAVSGLATASNAFSTSEGKGKADLASAFSTGIYNNQNGMTIIQQQLAEKEVVTLMNNTDRTINLDGEQPISLERVNGSLMVKVNTTHHDEGAIAVLPSVRFTIDIEEVSANIINNSSLVKNVMQNHAMISSDHSLFNQLIPVNIFLS